MLAIAQEENIFSVYNNSANSVIGTSANYNANSTSITNSLMSSFWKREYISNDMKANSISRLHDYTILGAGYHADIRYAFFKDSTNDTTRLGFVFGVESNAFVDAGFSRNAFKLIMNGNKQFEGVPVNIDKTGFNIYNYQQIKGGVIKQTKLQDHSFAMGAAIAINLGQNFSSLFVNKGVLYTEPNAETIDITANMKYVCSDTANGGLGSINGVGASIDLFYNFLDKNDNEFRVELSNLGFIKWNKHSLKFETDTAYHFEGVYVPDVFSADSTSFQLASDTMLNVFNSGRQKHSHTTDLPGLIQMNYKYYIFEKKMSVTAGLNFLIFSFANPMIYIKPTYSPTPNMHISAGLTYGGYGKFNAGLSLSATICKSFDFDIGTYYLNGYLMPDKASGQGLFIALRKTF